MLYHLYWFKIGFWFQFQHPYWFETGFWFELSQGCWLQKCFHICNKYKSQFGLWNAKLNLQALQPQIVFNFLFCDPRNLKSFMSFEFVTLASWNLSWLFVLQPSQLEIFLRFPFCDHRKLKSFSVFHFATIASWNLFHVFTCFICSSYYSQMIR